MGDTRVKTCPGSPAAATIMSEPRASIRLTMHIRGEVSAMCAIISTIYGVIMSDAGEITCPLADW